MIYDKKSNAPLYYGGHARLDKALKWLYETDIDALADGRHEIEGTDIYVMVSNAETKPLEQSKLETHDKYIDIQYVHKGEEYMGFLPAEFLGSETSRNNEKDVAFFEGKPDLVKITGGYFMVVFPHDAHAPRIAIGAPAKTKKAVVKVLY